MQQALFLVMACSLRAWFGASLASTKSWYAKIVLIAKLGGNILGDAEPKQDHEDQEAFLRRLKDRIAKLMPHGSDLPPKFINVELVGNNALAFWDEAKAKAEFSKKYGSSSGLYGDVLHVFIPNSCAKVGKLVNLFCNTRDVRIDGDKSSHEVDIQTVLCFPALKHLTLHHLSVDLELLPSSVEKLYLINITMRRLKRLGAAYVEDRFDLTNQPTRLLPQLCRLVDLKVLKIHACRLSGSIPTELGLMDLEVLVLSDNQLTGTIPSEFGGLQRLTSLRLYKNQLSGRIPTELGLATSLRILWLHSNKLTGSFPSELGQLDGLTLRDNLMVVPYNLLRLDPYHRYDL